MFKKTQFLFFVLILAGVFLVGTIGCGQQNEDSQEPKQTIAQKKSDPNAQKAFNFELRDLDGKLHKLSDFKGNVVILDFWDTWCGPCRMEIPHFVELYKQYADSGFVMIGVAGARMGIDAVRSFIRQYDVPYLNLLATQEVFDGYGSIEYIPTTFVIDQEGYIYKKYIGYNPKQQFENDIKALLAIRKK